MGCRYTKYLSTKYHKTTYIFSTPFQFGSNVNPTTESLPEKAKVVIVGGGAQGTAIAYKLAQAGLGADTVVIDQGQLGGGSTWHSAGIISQLSHSSVETRLTQLSKQLYLELEEKGYFTGWKQVGSLYVAQNNDRLHFYKRFVFRINLEFALLYPSITCVVLLNHWF